MTALRNGVWNGCYFPTMLLCKRQLGIDTAGIPIRVRVRVSVRIRLGIDTAGLHRITIEISEPPAVTLT